MKVSNDIPICAIETEHISNTWRNDYRILFIYPNGTTKVVSTSARFSDVLRTVRDLKKSGRCADGIDEQKASSFSANGDEVDPNSLD